MTTEKAGLLDISVKAHRERKGQDARMSNYGSWQRDRGLSTLILSRDQILEPKFLKSLLPGVRERGKGASALTGELDEVAKNTVSLLPTLQALSLNTLMLAERGVDTMSMSREFGIHERDVQGSFTQTYEKLGMQRIHMQLKRRVLFAAWRMFVEQEASK